MLTRLDHLVILVGDLDVAAADGERLGFALTPGGEHAAGLTRDALVDGSQELDPLLARGVGIRMQSSEG